MISYLDENYKQMLCWDVACHSTFMSDSDLSTAETEALLIDYRHMEGSLSSSYTSQGGSNGAVGKSRRQSSDEELLDTMIVGQNLETATGFANRDLDHSNKFQSK